jgi:uncharacterized membrane protein YsdA (DUF1294 family)/cold shock CspA family protein
MELHGTLKSWNDDKGFGFIRPAAGGEDVFVHISAVRGDQRPQVSEAVAYVVARDERGRLRAGHMRTAGALSIDDPGIRHRPKPVAPKKGPGSASGVRRPDASQAAIRHLPVKFTLLALLCVLPAWGALQALGAGVPWIGLGYLLFSLLSFGQYWSDKRKAQAGHWRVTEASLHLVELLGGWPGALVAQQLFRHKTRKFDFQVICWGIVAAHQCFWLERLLLDGRFLGPLNLPGL